MNSAKPLALDFKSATIYTVRLMLNSDNTESLISALNQRMQEAGSFFENEAVVIDANNIDGLIDWESFILAARQHKLHPVGVTAKQENLTAALQHGLVEFDLSAPAPASKPYKSDTKETDKPINATTAMVVNRPLRSGQRIYARHTDLIVVGMVSQGAEVIADGNIHIYGPLRGKAMAGAHGDTKARIFTTQLDPELLAIAGIYRVIETRLDPNLHNQPAVVQLEGEHLKIRRLDA